MIKAENIDVIGIEGAIRGMRNPMDSWDKSDSGMCLAGYDDCHLAPAIACPKNGDWDRDCFCVGEKDFDLMKRLVMAGTEHRKFLRMIHIQMDVTAPLYWWKEFDTYKVGVVANSCSTMHKIHSKEFTIEDFGHEHLDDATMIVLDTIIDALNTARDGYNQTHDKGDWWQMIQLLPSSYNQLRTLDFNYETALSIISQRQWHKLDEWRGFCKILLDLPYMRELTEAMA